VAGSLATHRTSRKDFHCLTRRATRRSRPRCAFTSPLHHHLQHPLSCPHSPPRTPRTASTATLPAIVRRENRRIMASPSPSLVWLLPPRAQQHRAWDVVSRATRVHARSPTRLARATTSGLQWLVTTTRTGPQQNSLARVRARDRASQPALSTAKRGKKRDVRVKAVIGRR
jgi:hypothetical protein